MKYIRLMIRIPFLILALPIIIPAIIFGWAFDYEGFKIKDIIDSDYFKAWKP